MCSIHSDNIKHKIHQSRQLVPIPVVYISICTRVAVMFEYQCFAGGHFLTYYQSNWFPPSVNSFVTGLKSSQMTPISYILSIQSTRSSIIHSGEGLTVRTTSTTTLDFVSAHMQWLDTNFRTSLNTIQNFWTLCPIDKIVDKRRNASALLVT